MSHLVGSVLGWTHTPNFLPKTIFGYGVTWMRHAGRLIWASILYLTGLGIAFYLTTKPKPVEPATWAKTIFGAILVWVMLILGYGTVPHEWLQFGASYLNFGTDTFFLRKHQIGAFPPFDVTRQVVVHVVVVGIYAFSLTMNIWLFARWQKRPIAQPAAEGEGEASEVEPSGSWLRRRLRRTSAYGRPVTVNE
jgi:hypothetical protein